VVWQAEENDGAEAAESYRPHDNPEEDLLSVFAATNALSLVRRGKNLMRFVKYVSASAPSSRWDVTAEYKLS
jgi:prolyl 3-hydroxylase /prolyl 3,4-dihydroxylase